MSTQSKPRLPAEQPPARPTESGKAPGRIRLIAFAVYVASTAAVLFSNLQGELRVVCILAPAVPLFLALLAAWAINRARRVQASAARAWLHEFGRPAVATVLSMLNLQEAINSDPVVRVTVRLSPTDGGPTVEGTRDMYVSSITVPWLGGRVPAYYDPADPNCFVLITSVDDDTLPRVREAHEQIRAEQDTEKLVATAGRDVTLAALVQLGVLEQRRRDGNIADDDYRTQRMAILDQHFP